MPVDKQRHIEEDFLEESWGQMSTLLDQEMPLNQKPKPPGKSWLTAILLLLFAWTTYLYWPVQESSLERAGSEVIENNNTEKGSEEPIALNDIVNAPSELITELIPPVVDDKQINEEPNPALVIAEKIVEAQFIPNKLPLVNELQISASTEILTSPKTIDNAKASNPGLSEKSIKKQEENFDEVQIVERKKLKELQDLESISKFDIVDYDANLPKWTVGVNYEAVFDRRLRSGNYYGLQVKRKLSNQFSLQTGVGFSEYEKLNPAENSFDAFSGMAVRYDYDDQRVSIIGIEKLSYITVPMELVFEVRKKWSVIAGLGFSYMLDAEFVQGQNEESWQSHADGSIVNSEKALLGQALQRFDIAPSIGFSFKPTKRIGVDLKFRNGILDISKDKFLGFNEFHSNRYLHLGISYDLLKF